jgi:hypothetical protein
MSYNACMQVSVDVLIKNIKPAISQENFCKINYFKINIMSVFPSEN